MEKSLPYLMENFEEALRLELKTDPKVVRNQANWCGVKKGMNILDAGCGPGFITSILYDMVKVEGSVLGIDFSKERIQHAKNKYGQPHGIDFQLHDLRLPLSGMGPFDLIWVRFVLEYNRNASQTIVKNLSHCLKPGGILCLLDLDNNCLSHYELPVKMEHILQKLMIWAEHQYDFDPYAGRKLYSYLYDLDFKDIEIDLKAHHLIYGEVNDVDIFNWIKKVEVASNKAMGDALTYPGGPETFLKDFLKFFQNPRRFTYTPLILCKGVKPFPEGSLDS
jgi:SAM-dependent methyltransferase